MSTVKADYLVNAAGTGAPTLTNGAVLPAGSAAAPAISPTGDTNTGVFFPAADTVAVSTAGSERLRVDSSGNVMLGTTDTTLYDNTSGTGVCYRAGASFDVLSASDNALILNRAGSNGGIAEFRKAGTSVGSIDVTTTSLAVSAITTLAFQTASTERMRIDASGNVGIGTTSPGALLDVRNGSNTGGSGTWLTKVHQTTNASGANGLSVMNTWSASTSKVLELAIAWNGTTDGYYPIFQIDGINQRFSAIYGSGGSAAVATLYPEFQCRAWVNFNGTGTVAIRASGNVSSITDNGTGDYTVNFATAMPDANYAYSHSYSNEVSGQHTVGFFHSMSSSQLRVQHFNAANSGNVVDKAYVFIAVFR